MSRGRIEPPKEAPRRVSKHPSNGSGPPCPDGHGALYTWEGGRWFCAHSEHGGNGKLFTDKEVN